MQKGARSAERKEKMKHTKKILTVCGMAAFLAIASLEAPVMTAQAAETQTVLPQIVLSQSAVTLAEGANQNITVDYTGVPGGFADLGVAVSDESQVQAVLADAGNGQAVLNITALQRGSGTVAVYLKSNMAVVSYVTVASGYAPKGQVYTTMTGEQLTTVYEDRIVDYKTTATGRDGELLAISGLQMIRNKGLDCLEITGQMFAQGNSNSGMSTFYANFYDAAGSLIKRQAVYALAPLHYDRYTLDWYIPEGCTRIVVE